MRGKALSILNKNAKKRKRPTHHDKRKMSLGLSAVQAVDVDQWESPGIVSPTKFKKKRFNDDGLFTRP